MRRGETPKNPLSEDGGLYDLLEVAGQKQIAMVATLIRAWKNLT